MFRVGDKVEFVQDLYGTFDECGLSVGQIGTVTDPCCTGKRDVCVLIAGGYELFFNEGELRKVDDNAS